MSLTVLIPAYNEEARIEPFLKRVLDWKKRHAYFKELILIDDGSTDNTAEILHRYKKQARILMHDKNQGKGAAIRTGVLAATQDMIAFLDADGSTPVKELDKMVSALGSYPVVVGTRKRKQSKVLTKQPLKRRLASKGFNTIVNLLFDTGSDDALCGFKGMRRDIGRKIARDMISKAWIFDVEILARARKMGAEIGVIPIEWHHEEGSKMRFGLTTVKMFLNLIRLRIALWRS